MTLSKGPTRRLRPRPLLDPQGRATLAMVADPAPMGLPDLEVDAILNFLSMLTPPVVCEWADDWDDSATLPGFDDRTEVTRTGYRRSTCVL